MLIGRGSTSCGLDGLRRRMRAGLWVFLLVAPGVAAADAVEQGRTLALHWCTGCHLVEADQPGGDAGPPFASLATTRSESALRAWLFEPHPPMPDLQLTAAEIDAILAYLRSFEN